MKTMAILQNEPYIKTEKTHYYINIIQSDQKLDNVHGQIRSNVTRLTS